MRSRSETHPDRLAWSPVYSHDAHIRLAVKQSSLNFFLHQPLKNLRCPVTKNVLAKRKSKIILKQHHQYPKQLSKNLLKKPQTKTLTMNPTTLCQAPQVTLLPQPIKTIFVNYAFHPFLLIPCQTTHGVFLPKNFINTKMSNT